MALPSLHDRVVVVTGASRGLGAGMAERFRSLGMRVGVCARGASPLAGRSGVVAQRLDVRDEAAMQGFAAAVAAELGPIDLWVNNAGVLEPIAFLRDLSGEALMEHLAINVGGVLAGSKAFVGHLHRTGRGGVLVNVSSGAAQRGYAGWTAYCAGKAAVDRLSECVQLEEAEHGLRAYAVAPGVVDTAMQTTIRGMSEERFPAVEKFRELKRNEAFNSPAFVADRIAALAFDPEARPDSVVLRLPSEQG
ncbi:MAG: SDR family NAD(P)-dependent oxidoreductase [Myxococcales bacterium]|nr:SDR family NAD(P)-dependent oxidoreductase [Myxococcales bacterium]MCB9716291.1 SDR family NAD(P)-dependent oxidoreductase [Myxococcales bacterium]